MGSIVWKGKATNDISRTRYTIFGLLRILAAFLLGYLVSQLSTSTRGVRISKTGIDCAISFGNTKYRGPQYMAEATVGSPKCLVESKFLKVQQHSVRLEGRSDIIDDWLWIDYHDRINVLIDVSGSNEGNEPSFLVFEQTKYALEDRKSLAIVGGIIEPGESPEEAALREVLEETKNRCEKLHFLGRYRTDVNRGMGWTNCFIASQCRRVGFAEKAVDQVGDADSEQQDVRIMSLTDIRKAALEGKFLEIQWSATVALAMIYFER